MVRINSTVNTIQLIDQVREQRETNEDRDPDGRRHDQGEQRKKDETPYSATQEQVEQAARDMAKDEQTRASGIQVALEGMGPGLRVTLKDADGSVLRHMSGEEFVKLREAAREGAPKRGRLLDRKL